MDTDLCVYLWIPLQELRHTPSWTMVTSGWARNSWSTALRPHYQPIRGGLHTQQPTSQILSVKSCPKPLSLPVLLALLLLLFSHSVMSNSVRPHGLQHARLPYPSLSPGACSNSCPLSQWYHPTISSFSSRPLLLLPSTFPSIRIFSNESALSIRWPKY